MADFLFGFIQFIAFLPVFLVSIVCFIFYVVMVLVFTSPLIVASMIHKLFTKIRNAM